MEFIKDLLPIIFTFFIIPVLGILTSVLVKFIKQKGSEIADATANQVAAKYIRMLTDTVCECVTATNQTYVNALKEQGAFDEAAQKEAFRRTYEAVIKTLNEEVLNYLTEFYGDFETALTTLIESNVATAYNKTWSE